MDGWQTDGTQGRATAAPGLDDQRGGHACVLSADLKITGQVHSAGAIRVEGQIIGDIQCATLLVTNTANVHGAILAEYVVVHGVVKGSIYADKVMLHAEAQVEGDIFHHGIGIEMGTRYDGRLKWTENPQSFFHGTPPTPSVEAPPPIA